MIVGRKRRRAIPLIDPDLKSIVEELQRSLGKRVRLMPKARSAKGKIEIEYYTLADLERIIQTITKQSGRYIGRGHSASAYDWSRIILFPMLLGIEQRL